MLDKIISNKNLSQRALAKRLGYSSPGIVWQVLNGRAGVPQDDIPKWADALELTGQEREKFIEWASKRAIPDWVQDELRHHRSLVNLLTELVAHREEAPLPHPADVTRTADERLVELSNLRRVNLAMLQKIRILTGIEPPPRLRGGEPEGPGTTIPSA